MNIAAGMLIIVTISCAIIVLFVFALMVLLVFNETEMYDPEDRKDEDETETN